MSGSALDLTDVLRREADLYDDLLVILAEEEAALVAGDTRTVGDCLARTETLVLKLRLLETSRQSLVAQLTGRPDALLSELPAGAANALQPVRARLDSTLPRIERMNRRLSALLGRALNLFGATLDLIRDAAGLSHQYTAHGGLTRASLPTIDGRA
jgi:flagellar biosynthesis/type III secretory pathway chaperone